MKLRKIALAASVAMALGISSTAAVAASSPTPRTSGGNADLNSLKQRVAKIEAVMNQNEGSVLHKDPYLGSDWAKRITVSGEILVDAVFSSSNGRTNLNPAGTDPVTGASTFGNSYFNAYSGNDIYLNNSQLDVDAYVNNWTRAHISLTGNDPYLVNRRKKNLSGNNDIQLDEAYVTVGDLNMYPVYVTAGRQYIPFGHYTRHQVAQPLTALLQQTQATAAKLGFATAYGFYGSVYGFRGGHRGNLRESNYRVGNFGADLGITDTNVTLPSGLGGMHLGYQLSVSYLNNMSDVDLVSDVLASAAPAGTTGNSSIVRGLSVDARIATGPFAVWGSYVTALDQFSRGPLNNTKPAAWRAAGSYGFRLMDRDTTLSARYQQSTGTRLLGMPRLRGQLDYKVDILKDTYMTFVVFEDKNYNTQKNREYRTVGAVRLGVVF